MFYFGKRKFKFITSFKLSKIGHGLTFAGMVEFNEDEANNEWYKPILDYHQVNECMERFNLIQCHPHAMNEICWPSSFITCTVMLCRFYCTSSWCPVLSKEATIHFLKFSVWTVLCSNCLMYNFSSFNLWYFPRFCLESSLLCDWVFLFISNLCPSWGRWYSQVLWCNQSGCWFPHFSLVLAARPSIIFISLLTCLSWTFQLHVDSIENRFNSTRTLLFQCPCSSIPVTIVTGSFVVLFSSSAFLLIVSFFYFSFSRVWCCVYDKYFPLACLFTINFCIYWVWWLIFVPSLFQGFPEACQQFSSGCTAGNHFQVKSRSLFKWYQCKTYHLNY